MYPPQLQRQLSLKATSAEQQRGGASTQQSPQVSQQGTPVIGDSHHPVQQHQQPISSFMTASVDSNGSAVNVAAAAGGSGTFTTQQQHHLNNKIVSMLEKVIQDQQKLQHQMATMQQQQQAFFAKQQQHPPNSPTSENPFQFPKYHGNRFPSDAGVGGLASPTAASAQRAKQRMSRVGTLRMRTTSNLRGGGGGKTSFYRDSNSKTGLLSPRGRKKSAVTPGVLGGGGGHPPSSILTSPRPGGGDGVDGGRRKLPPNITVNVSLSQPQSTSSATNATGKKKEVCFSDGLAFSMISEKSNEEVRSPQLLNSSAGLGATFNSPHVMSSTQVGSSLRKSLSPPPAPAPAVGGHTGKNIQELKSPQSSPNTPAAPGPLVVDVATLPTTLTSTEEQFPNLSPPNKNVPTPKANTTNAKKTTDPAHAVETIPDDLYDGNSKLSCPDVTPYEVAVSHNGAFRRSTFFGSSLGASQKLWEEKQRTGSTSVFATSVNTATNKMNTSFGATTGANHHRGFSITTATSSITPSEELGDPLTMMNYEPPYGLQLVSETNSSSSNSQIVVDSAHTSRKEDGFGSDVDMHNNQSQLEASRKEEEHRQQRKKLCAPEQDFLHQLLNGEHNASHHSLGSDDVAATAADVIYLVLSTVIMYVALTTLAHIGRGGDDAASENAAVLSLDLGVSILTIGFAVLKSRTRVRLHEWDIVDNIADLRKLYLRSPWLIVDLITILPVELAFLTWSSVGFAIAMQRHLLRLPRILTLYSSTNPLLESRQWFSIGFIICITVLVAEAVALAFLNTDSEHHGHMDSVYWTVTTLTSVGYGDILPTNDDTKLLSIFGQIFGIIMIAAITSVGTQFLTTKDPVRQDFEKRKQMMYSMLQFYNVPWEVQKEVISLFPSVLANHNEAQFHDLACNLPQVVAKKVEVFLRRKLISNVPLFRDFVHNGNDVVLLEIASVLDSLMYEPGEYIITAGEEGREMFFVASGSVDILVPIDEFTEKVVAVLRNGQWFGEIALIEDTVRTASVQAVETCEMLVLGKEAFLSIAMRHEQLMKVLNEEAAARRRANLNKAKHTETNQRDDNEDDANNPPDAEEQDVRNSHPDERLPNPTAATQQQQHRYCNEDEVEDTSCVFGGDPNAITVAGDPSGGKTSTTSIGEQNGGGQLLSHSGLAGWHHTPSDSDGFNPLFPPSAHHQLGGNAANAAALDEGQSD